MQSILIFRINIQKQAEFKIPIKIYGLWANVQQVRFLLQETDG